MIHWIVLGLVALAGLGILAAYKAESYDVSGAGATVAAVSGVAAFIVGAIWGILALGAAECRQIERSTGEDTSFYAIGGCFVHIDDVEVPVDERSIGLIVRELSK